MLPLTGIVALDFSQFLAGPSAALRLADLGATVIKIERPTVGELGRRLYISNLRVDSDSTLFHTINRNKQSYAADLKNNDDLSAVRRLIAKADILIENFRPGVMDRLGLGYDAVKQLRPELVYASVTGYGKTGPWRDKPGQDLLVQAMSGLTWLSGARRDPPIPIGLSVVDMFAGAHLTQGILSCLVRRAATGKGGLVEVSLLESAIDMQFELLTTFLNDGKKPPNRGAENSANAYLSAPYGVFQTADGFLALSMAVVPRLGDLLGIPALQRFADPKSWFEERDAIMLLLAARLKTGPTESWLRILEPAEVWCADVLTWERLVEHRGFQDLAMTQSIGSTSERRVLTTRCPIRLDGAILKSSVGAPQVGEHTAEIVQRFRLENPTNLRVGVIGLGTLGAPIAKRLIDAGFVVNVYNRTVEKTAALGQLGAQVAATPAQVAETCDVIILTLADDASVTEVISGPNGITSAQARGATIINISTVSPQTNIQLLKELQQHGMTLLEAPVTGSRAQAESGTLYFLVGGERDVYEACIPVLDRIGRGHVLLGGVGTGSCAKIANNLMAFINLAGLSEALGIVSSFGLDPELFLKTVAQSGARSAIAEAKGPKMLANDWSPQFALTLAAKDLRLGRELAAQVGRNCPVLDEVSSVYTRAAKEFGDDDVCGLRQWYDSDAVMR